MTEAAPVEIEGYVDSCEGGRLKGWAWRPARPADVVVIEALADGQVIASGPAYLHRPDVERARGGAVGFELLVDVAAGTSIEVRPQGGGTLVGAPIVCVSAAAMAEAPARLPDVVGVRGSLDEFGPLAIRGWAFSDEPGASALDLELFDGETAVATTTANRWRHDLENLRDGDGACEFVLPFPQGVLGGAVHRIDVRLAGGGHSIFERPVELAVPRAQAVAETKAAAATPGPRRLWGKPGRDLSIIVVFYNMRREAERTLHSLSRAYQQGVADLDYEVVCVDNGSKEPLDAAWIASFGPEFRLASTSQILPSPCFAMNEAAQGARGKRLAMMIDGAHVLTPGAIAEAMKAMDEAPGSIVALRQWFVDGDQRWLSAAGYSRKRENKLFEKISWPSDGYRLFEISSPMFESPNHWFDGLNESNCLFLDAALYKRIGGMDVGFSEPGAGFANLDLFRRAALASERPVIVLVGEASFHQFHGGTTTNVADATKDALIDSYHANYRKLRGEELKAIPPTSMYFRGTLRTDQALTARQHLLFPGGVGVTDQLRPVKQEEFFEEEAQAYARTIYAESGQHALTRWLGEPVDLAPADLTNIQEIMRLDRPRRIVVADDRAGLVGFIGSVRRELGLADCEIVHVRPRHGDSAPGEGVFRIEGPVMDAGVLDQIRQRIADAGPVMVLFEPAPGDWFPVEAMATYGDFVTPGGHLIVLRTALGQPWLGYAHNRRFGAAQQLVARGRFEFEPNWQKQIITLCPFGYLRRL